MEAAKEVGAHRPAYDPEYMLERLRRGDDPAELLRPGAGTPPGITPRANRRAITWKTL
ncbi:hypothetical protein ACWDBW_40240 [Streptomyces sp. NPDC001107]